MPVNSFINKKIINSTLAICVLSLLFIVALTNRSSAYQVKKIKKKSVEYSLTVAQIKPVNPEETFIRVSFLESARFYKLPKNADPSYLKLLKTSEKKHIPVLVKRANEESDVIVSVKKADASKVKTH